MSNEENFKADPAALGQSGKTLSAFEARVNQVASDVNRLAVDYPNVAGDGDYREAFDKKYPPLADAARDYMWSLSEAVRALGKETIGVAEVFENTDSDATKNARR